VVVVVVVVVVVRAAFNHQSPSPRSAGEGRGEGPPVESERLIYPVRPTGDTLTLSHEDGGEGTREGGGRSSELFVGIRQRPGCCQSSGASLPLQSLQRLRARG